MKSDLRRNRAKKVESEEKGKREGKTGWREKKRKEGGIEQEERARE